jgi:transcriptional regulator with XRE-family HTH domain
MSRTTWHRYGLALKAWREAHQLSLNGAGKLLGVTGVQVYRYERGLRRVPPERVIDISGVTGIPPEQLRPDVFRQSLSA